MKTRKTKFLIGQVLMILGVNFVFLVANKNFNINEGFGSKLIFVLAFFHAGVFTSLYLTLDSKELSQEKYSVLFKFLFSVFFFSLFIVFYFKCQPKTEKALSCYILGILTLLQSIAAAIETYKSYRKYRESINVD